MPHHLLSIDDLSDEAVARVLERAGAFEKGEPSSEPFGPIVGLVFLDTSLRTRVGFSVAASRLGGRAVEVADRRSSVTSMPESVEDTIRTVSGMVDIVVARIGRSLDRAWVTANTVGPLINGGDIGPCAEHPSQALVDQYAIEHECGPVSELTIAICGDLRMRSVRSLLRLLARRPPRAVVLISAPGIDEVDIPPPLATLVDRRALSDIEDIDVLYVAGIPHQALAENLRHELTVDSAVFARLPERAIVLSPLPVLDEIESSARDDQRVRAFSQSDRGVFVRMAVLEEMLRGDG